MLDANEMSAVERSGLRKTTMKTKGQYNAPWRYFGYVISASSRYIIRPVEPEEVLYPPD